MSKFWEKVYHKEKAALLCPPGTRLRERQLVTSDQRGTENAYVRTKEERKEKIDTKQNTLFICCSREKNRNKENDNEKETLLQTGCSTRPEWVYFSSFSFLFFLPISRNTAALENPLSKLSFLADFPIFLGADSSHLFPLFCLIYEYHLPSQIHRFYGPISSSFSKFSYFYQELSFLLRRATPFPSLENA